MFTILSGCYVFSCIFHVTIARTSSSQVATTWLAFLNHPVYWCRDGRNSLRGIKKSYCENRREYTESNATETHRSTDLVVGQFHVANARALRHKSKRCCVVSECCATICMRDRRTSEACTGRFTCSGEACHVCRLRPLVTQSLRTSFSATTSVVSRRLTFSTDRSTRKRLTGHVCSQWLCVARPQVQTVAKLRTPTTLYKTDHYTVNHKKRDILFLTITLANLNRFLYHFNR